MKNPFKKKKEETIVEPEAVKQPEPTLEKAVIKTVVGYKLDNVIFESLEQARACYIADKLRELVSGDHYLSSRYEYDVRLVVRNYQAIKQLLLEEIPVQPLYGEAK